MVSIGYYFEAIIVDRALLQQRFEVLDDSIIEMAAF